MKVSVIIPNYNHSGFLEQRLSSIMQQTYRDFEVIILDDCSTDESREIIEKYRDHPKVRSIVYNEVNSGRPILQWLKGITLASSEWIWIAESDDYCEPVFLESLAHVFDNRNVVLALSDICFINKADQIINSFLLTDPGTYKGNVFIAEKMLEGCFVCNSGMAVFRKNAAPELGSWVEQFNFSPDYYFWTSIMQAGDVYSCGKRLAFFRKHDAEFTHGKLESVAAQQDHALLLDQLYKKGLCNKDQLEQLIILKLVNFYTQQKGIAPAVFKSLTSTWNQLARDSGISVNYLAIQAQAMVRKLKHRFKAFYAIS